MSSSLARPVDSPGNELSPSAVLPDAEFELLLCCCTQLSPNREARIRALLQQRLSWEKLFQSAQHHGLVPRLYQTLLANPALVPKQALADIHRLYESNAQLTLWLTRELVRVLSHFGERKISALPFKGPSLAQSLYGNVTARQYSDLDILIHVADFARAKSALQQLGFRPGMELTPQQERCHVHTGYEFTFDSPCGRNLLELQWQVLPRFYCVDFDVNGFFERASVQPLAGMMVRSMTPKELLLTLCAHAWKHAWIQLSWLCDIREIAESNKLDWDAVWREASSLGIRRIVAITFLLARRLFGTTLPEGLQSDHSAEQLAESVIPLIRNSTPFNRGLVSYFRLIARARERTRDRAKFWWRLAVTPGAGEWSTVKLPEQLFPLYRVIRLGRVARWLF